MSDFLNADKARQLTQDAEFGYFKTALADIRAAAKAGQVNVKVAIPRRFIVSVKARLEDLGYHVGYVNRVGAQTQLLIEWETK